MELQIQLSGSFAEKYERSSHSIGISMWHFEWCTKYRYQMFRKEEQRNLVSACIRKVASMHDIKIIELNVQPDHVHCVVGISLSISPAYALQIMKGGSAYLFFKYQYKARLRYPRGHLWSPGKFVASVGFIQLDTAKEYVRNQEVKYSGSPAL